MTSVGKKHVLPGSVTKQTPIDGGIMQAQLITYHLRDISQAEYLKQMVEPDAPVLAKVPGLISKIWLKDEEKNTFGGFYLWENKPAMEAFMHSDLVKAVVSRPFVVNVSSVDFEVNENASFITRGLK
ncbi:MAG TPA: YdhR family protein [Gemmatimonadaceae bacterium]|nr:YdhR family protein [Gemmatimonadaceae bacterium]